MRIRTKSIVQFAPPCQLRDQGACRSRGIRCSAKGRDYRNPKCAVSKNLGHPLDCDSADRKEWNRALCYCLTQTSESLRLSILCFARRGIHRPENEEVSSRSRSYFFWVMGGYPNQFPWA